MWFRLSLGITKVYIYIDKLKNQLERQTVVELKGKDGKDQGGAVSTCGAYVHPTQDKKWFLYWPKDKLKNSLENNYRKKENTLRLKAQCQTSGGPNYKIGHELYWFRVRICQTISVEISVGKAQKGLRSQSVTTGLLTHRTAHWSPKLSTQEARVSICFHSQVSQWRQLDNLVRLLECLRIKQRPEIKYYDYRCCYYCYYCCYYSQ